MQVEASLTTPKIIKLFQAPKAIRRPGLETYLQNIAPELTITAEKITAAVAGLGQEGLELLLILAAAKNYKIEWDIEEDAADAAFEAHRSFVHHLLAIAALFNPELIVLAAGQKASLQTTQAETILPA